MSRPIINETLQEVLSVHFEHLTQTNIGYIVNGWSSDRENREQYKNAVEYLFRATNEPREEFLVFLNEGFGNPVEWDVSFRNSFHILNTLSKHSTGNVNEEDILFKHCSRVSSLGSQDLKIFISQNLKGRTDAYLQEEYADFYEEVREELAQEGCIFAMRPSNDLDEEMGSGGGDGGDWGWWREYSKIISIWPNFFQDKRIRPRSRVLTQCFLKLRVAVRTYPNVWVGASINQNNEGVGSNSCCSYFSGRAAEILVEYYKIFSEEGSQLVSAIKNSGLTLSRPGKMPKTAAVNYLMCLAKAPHQD